MIPLFSTKKWGRFLPRPIGWSRSLVTNQVTFVTRSTTHLLLGLCWRIHSKKSMLLISSIARSKSSWLETRNGCSNTKLLLAEEWWYWRAPVSVLRRINPKAKLTLKTVVWSAKMRFSCSRRLVGLIVDRRKLYQSWSRFWRLNRVRICGQCCRYIWAMFSWLLGTRFVGISSGSASQLEPAVAVDGWGVADGSEAVLAWSVLLDFLAAGASVFFSAAGRLRAGCAVECAVRIWAL